MRSSHALMHMLDHVSPLSLILQWVGRIIPNVRRDLFWSACFVVNILHMSQCKNTNWPRRPESLCCCTDSESASSPSTLIWFWEVFDSWCLTLTQLLVLSSLKGLFLFLRFPISLSGSVIDKSSHHWQQMEKPFIQMWLCQISLPVFQCFLHAKTNTAWVVMSDLWKSACYEQDLFNNSVRKIHKTASY